MSKQVQTTQAPPPDTLTDHQYDGICEYDNPTPGWWFMIFALSVVWAFGYWIRYELNTTPPTVHADWEQDVADANRVMFSKLGDLKPDADTLLSLGTSAEWMPVAASMFRANCIACHGRQGQGDVGPNLTDSAYKNIKQITDIPTVIREGANGQAMPPWRGRLSENEIILISSYVASLRGQNLPGRAAEGDVLPPWPKRSEQPAGASPTGAPWEIVIAGCVFACPLLVSDLTVEETFVESLLQPEKRVLSTLNDDGSRRWLKPRPSRGRYWRRRRAVAYGLITLFVGLPYLRINDKPAVLLDIVHREFTLMGRTFLPTDTVLLALLIVGVFVAVFFATAVLGRVWCGWACPQTVYLEYLFRPIERLLEGEPGSPRKRAPWMAAAKYPVYLVLSALLAHTFLAYFVGIEALLTWVRQSPFNHPVPFLVMAITTGLMMFDFSFFREQLCIIACPYGRMQSVMLDRGSLIVSYDRARGEPRGKSKRPSVSLNVLPAEGAKPAGDCVDCLRCVTTCPTGIDIRDGLQMECIACTQCIDACDDVMTKLKRPIGLIRYASQRTIDGAPKKFRPRLAIYSAVLVGIAATLTVLLLNAAPFDVRLLRGRGQPFSVAEDGRIVGTLQLKLTNRSGMPSTYSVRVVHPVEGGVHFDENPVTVAPGEMRTQGGTLLLGRSDFGAFGTCPVQIEITDATGYSRRVAYTALGPAGKEVAR